MKLKSSAVEILRGNDTIFNSKGNFGMNNVQPKQPATIQARCKWIIGDVTEVFHQNTWKLGKILKMPKNDYFVIRLADCIQLKEFHISSLRIPKASEAAQGKHQPTSDKATRAAQQTNGKKRKATADASHHPSKRAHPRCVAPACALRGGTADSPSQVSRGEVECSVASCSVNDPDRFYCSTVRGSKRHAAAVGMAAAFPDDAMSSCPCTSSGMDDDEEEEGHRRDAGVDVDVHALELEAYRKTMRALHASGPLTWEQESLLTNLRMSLHISNEEHLRQLRRLLSSSS